MNISHLPTEILISDHRDYLKNIGTSLIKENIIKRWNGTALQTVESSLNEYLSFDFGDWVQVSVGGSQDSDEFNIEIDILDTQWVKFGNLYKKMESIQKGFGQTLLSIMMRLAPDSMTPSRLYYECCCVFWHSDDDYKLSDKEVVETLKSEYGEEFEEANIPYPSQFRKLYSQEVIHPKPLSKQKFLKIKPPKDFIPLHESMKEYLLNSEEYVCKDWGDEINAQGSTLPLFVFDFGEEQFLARLSDDLFQNEYESRIWNKATPVKSSKLVKVSLDSAKVYLKRLQLACVIYSQLEKLEKDYEIGNSRN